MSVLGPNSVHDDLVSAIDLRRELVGLGYLFHDSLGGFIHRVDSDHAAFVTEDDWGHGVLTFEDITLDRPAYHRPIRPSSHTG